MCCRAVFINPYPVGAGGKRFAFKAAVAENDDVFKLRTVEREAKFSNECAPILLISPFMMSVVAS